MCDRIWLDVWCYVAVPAKEELFQQHFHRLSRASDITNAEKKRKKIREPRDSSSSHTQREPWRDRKSPLSIHPSIHRWGFSFFLFALDLKKRKGERTWFLLLFIHSLNFSFFGLFSFDCHIGRWMAGPLKIRNAKKITHFTLPWRKSFFLLIFSRFFREKQRHRPFDGRAQEQ